MACVLGKSPLPRRSLWSLYRGLLHRRRSASALWSMRFSTGCRGHWPKTTMPVVVVLWPKNAAFVAMLEGIVFSTSAPQGPCILFVLGRKAYIKARSLSLGTSLFESSPFTTLLIFTLTLSSQWGKSRLLRSTSLVRLILVSLLVAYGPSS